MKNQQRPKGAVRSSYDGTLDVHSIFSTIQGEGPFAGRPAVFIRLADCNLQCPLCDTEYTGGLGVTATADVVAQVVVKYHPSLVVITGGEPLRQNILELCQLLAQQGVTCQIETNGMLAPKGDLNEWDDLIDPCVMQQVFFVVSPKTHRLNGIWKSFADAFKYVIRDGQVDVYDGLPLSALDHPIPRGEHLARPPAGWNGPVYVQPADEKDQAANERNMAAAVKSVLFAPHNRRLCLQMHKYANLE